MESIVAEGESSSNDVTWDDSWVFYTCVMPAVAQSDADADVASRARAHLEGQPVCLLCTLVLLPEGANLQVGGEVLGDLLIKMDKDTFSLSDQFFPLSLSRTGAQPRVIHPAPVVEVHLRLAYEDVSWQLQRAAHDLPLTPRAHAPGNVADDSQLTADRKKDSTASLQQRKVRLKVAAKHKTEQPTDVGGNPDTCVSIDPKATSTYSVSVRLLSTAGISTPEDFARETGVSNCWCRASVCMSADVGKLKRVQHVAPGSSSSDPREFKNSRIVAEAWCRPDASPLEAEPHSGASVCGWRSEEMVLNSAVESPSADCEAFELDGEPLILFITLHASLQEGKQEFEIARVLLPIRQGLDGDMWCLALTPDQQQLEVDAGPPCLVHVRVAYGRNAIASLKDANSSSSPARHQQDHMLSTNVFVSPAFGITNLLRAMVAAGPPCVLSDVATSSLHDADSNDLVLPAGWIRRMSRSLTKPYYASRGRTTKFEPPTGSRLAVVRIPPHPVSSPGVSDSVEGNWTVRLTIREAVGLAHNQAHTPAKHPAASPKVPRFRFAVSLIFFQQDEVDASHLLSLEHLLPESGCPASTRNSGGGGGVDMGKMRPQALSRWVAGASGISEVMDTFVLRNAVLVNQTGVSTWRSDQGHHVKDEPGAENTQEAALHVALKGRVVLLFVTVHSEDDSGAGGKHALFFESLHVTDV